MGDGFVHDDYGLGVEAALDLGAIGPSWDVAASAFYPTRDLPSGRGWASPVVAVRVDWLPSLFEHVGAFAAYQRDRTGSAAELFRGSLAEPSVLKLQGEQPGTAAYVAEERALLAIEGSYREGDSALWWVGTSGAVVPWRRAHLSWTAALNLGHVTIALPDAPLESSGSVFGRLVHAALRAFVGDEVELGGFFLYMSGDLPPTEKARLGLAESYGGFLGVVPFITLTNIFFNGGVGATFGAQQATAPGVNGRGVIAPGVTLGWDPLAVLGVDLRAAWLLADAAGPYGGRSYGPELDAEVSWSPLRWLRLTAEGDVLFPGDFFPGSAPVTKLVLALDLVGP